VQDGVLNAANVLINATLPGGAYLDASVFDTTRDHRCSWDHPIAQEIFRTVDKGVHVGFALNSAPQTGQTRRK
jgi:hypothetical protein